MKPLFTAWLLLLVLFQPAVYADSLYTPLDDTVYIPFAEYKNVRYRAEFSFLPPDKLQLNSAVPRTDNPVYGNSVSVAEDLSFHLSQVNFDGRLFQADLQFQGDNLFTIANLSEVPVTVGSRGNINSRTLKNAYSIAQIKSLMFLFNSFAGTDIQVPDSNGIKIFQVNYQTIDPAGESVTASALVSLPDDSNASYPLLAYQHFTIVKNSDAPTQVSQDIPSIGFAAKGYVTVAADYLGFGEGAGLHPYVHANSLASAVIDALRAARHLAVEENVNLNGQVFLIGYSEGGHATMAAQREIERHHAQEFNLVASAPIAGPYDLSETMINPFLDDILHPNPYFFPFTVLAYNQVYGLLDSLADYFQAPFDATIPPLYDGQLDSPEINAQLPDNRTLFTQSLYDDLNDSEQGSYFQAVMYENDVYRWKPKTKTLLYHCVNDNQVYYGNTQVAYDYFQAQGATQVELHAIENVGYDIGNVHVNCAIPLLFMGINRFDEML